jgi:TonB family protein
MKKNQRVNLPDSGQFIKILFLFFLGILNFQNGFGQTPNHQVQTDILYTSPLPLPDSIKVYTVAQVKPKFPGDINKYIADNIQYPDSARQKNIKGVVYVSFIVERNGFVSNIAILRTPDISLSNEARRLVSTMPRWVPGTQNGKTVRVQEMIPIRFQLEATKSTIH